MLFFKNKFTLYLYVFLHPVNIINVRQYFQISFMKVGKNKKEFFYVKGVVFFLVRTRVFLGQK